ncbi:hypothetical protein MKK67_20930 [Methylobacterium sp. J-072]|uniref:hypothetical protein n=1 Tax=Methylobacterium sp. J-072 TaxID=2836651 RepID=UPI001FB982EF|nr:hypothetical protein [Methylobacterium sp. J-072]MCJ2094946.1 hypothetical protein [Methylobacterium sp. J-072]
MRDYRFCVALRRADGTLDKPLHEEVITAEDGTSAIALAKAIDVDMLRLRANAIYLVDPHGYVAWSLRLADVSDVSA